MPNRLSLSGGAAIIQDLETRPCVNCEEKTETVGVCLDRKNSTDEAGIHFCPACLARDAIKTLVWIQEEYPGVVTLDGIIHDYVLEKYKEVGPEDE